jgi:hypothetical protein
MNEQYKGKVTLQRIRLNSGGYTKDGFYYGLGQPLWWYCADEVKHTLAEVSGYFRAVNRTAAKAYVRAIPLLKECRFYK